MSELPVRLSKDRSGRCKAAWKGTIPESGELLTEWLESDVQDHSFCGSLLSHAGSIHQARTGAWKTTGNAFRVEVGPRRVLLTPLFGMKVKPFRLPTPQFLALVETWRAML